MASEHVEKKIHEEYYGLDENQAVPSVSTISREVKSAGYSLKGFTRIHGAQSPAAQLEYLNAISHLDPMNMIDVDEMSMGRVDEYYALIVRKSLLVSDHPQ